ncbi:MAG: cytochrome P450 [Jatrophihabitans sp.]|uniref:cytochrome P450 n=1 Tax=Jatrophihabitans sp. TaxID=1932789 RepID=UPI003F80AFBC
MTDFPQASLIDSIRFTAQIAVPGVIQGLFSKRVLPVRVAAKAHADQFGHQLVQGMVDRAGAAPIALKVGTDDAVLVHTPEDLEFVLGHSPSPFASDPAAKHKGMAAFQPDALTISRGDLWANRRRFAEAVLDTGSPLHRLAPDFAAVAVAEADALVSARTVTWDAINAAFQRITRRVVFGDAATDDQQLTDDLAALMAAGNKMPGTPAPNLAAFMAKVQAHVDRAEPGSLCALIADAPSDDRTNVAGQVVHWLFAMGDTLPANLYRALALLASHPEQLREVRHALGDGDLTDPAVVAAQTYLAGCLQEAMRLWPTTALFGRVTTEEVTFPGGGVLPAGRQVFIYNVFNHRRRDLVEYADRFAPGEWASGDASENWLFNFFSHGPQGCPGAGLSIFLGQALVGRLLQRAEPRLQGVTLDPAKRLPYSLDIYGYSVALAPRA